MLRMATSIICLVTTQYCVYAAAYLLLDSLVSFAELPLCGLCHIYFINLF